MTRQIRLLTKLSLYGMFGFNEFRHTKDKKKKLGYCLMGVLWALLILMMAAYVGAASYGFVIIGMGYFVPAVLALVVSLVAFFFTIAKAGPVLFDQRAYEKQVALPVTAKSIIASRFLSMYLTDMLLGVAVMLPGMVVYGMLEKPGFTFYLYGAIVVLFLPLLPLTAASVAGALIAGIAGRWKRKNLVSILLTMIFLCVFLVGSMGMSRMGEDELIVMMEGMAQQLGNRIGSAYPPALWISEAMVSGKAAALVLFLGVSLGCFLIFLEILGHFYGHVCGLLSAREARGNYRMESLRARPVIRSLLEREWRRYFSSSIYVVNTLTGEVMMVLLAIGVAMAGKDSVDKMLGLPGVAERALPVLLGAFPVLMPLTACSLSMEGKSWWMMQTLPVSRRDMIRSKVALQLIVTLPFYLASEAILIAALRPGWTETISLLAVPAAYILFGARTGIAVNERFPVFDWDSEIKVVKQGASVFLMMVIGLVSAAAPIIALFILWELPAYAVYGIVVILLLLLTGLMELGGRKREPCGPYRLD